MTFSATLSAVGGSHGVALRNKARLPRFLEELIAWGRNADETIFKPRRDPKPPNEDIYNRILPILGDKDESGKMRWVSPLRRRAAMLEVLRVLAGFESSWDFDEGVDTTNARSMANITGQETGAFQVSFDSLPFGQELRECVSRYLDDTTPTPRQFIDAMKRNHTLAMEYAARLLRLTHRHNGPVLRHEIDPWLRRESVAEFETLLVA
jgi:hypothetical protein